MSEKIILPDSEEAARPASIVMEGDDGLRRRAKGWWFADNYQERMADDGPLSPEASEELRQIIEAGQQESADQAGVSLDLYRTILEGLS